MILDFATNFPGGKGSLSGKPTDFVVKIWASLLKNNVKVNVHQFTKYGLMISKEESDRIMSATPKIHTMRRDENDSWKAGELMSPYVNNDANMDLHQFAPDLNCTGTQKITIEKFGDSGLWQCDYLVQIDGVHQIAKSFPRLAKNSGFEDPEGFFEFFGPDYKGKIIHWTDFKYNKYRNHGNPELHHKD